MIKYFVLWNIFALYYSYSNLSICKKTDFHFEFTECDKKGGRWKVSVPEPNKCVGGYPEPPKRTNCTFSCQPGQYFDNNDEQCYPCPSSTYSLGDVVNFNEWKNLPQGFKVISEGLNSYEEGNSEYQDQTRNELVSKNCSKSIWKPSNSFIVSFPNLCIASLLLNIKLVKPGHLKFVYQYPNIDTFFNYMVINDECLSPKVAKIVKWPEVTKVTEWKTEMVNLKSGNNLIIWRSAGIMDNPTFASDAVKIKSIRLDGVAYVSQCERCTSGTFSLKGSTECTPCPFNTYSTVGSVTCEPCPEDEYSGIGSSQCSKRKPCGTNDMIKTFTSCDLSTKFRYEKYFWAEPKICSDTVKGSLKLPKNDNEAKKIDCEPCPPGTYYGKQFSSNQTTRPNHLFLLHLDTDECVTCPEGTFANGLNFMTECSKCPLATRPMTGFYFTRWFSIPKYLSTSCYTSIGECPSYEGWLGSGSFLGILPLYTETEPSKLSQTTRRNLIMEADDDDDNDNVKVASSKGQPSLPLTLRYYILATEAYVKPIDTLSKITFEFSLSPSMEIVETPPVPGGQWAETLLENCVFYFVQVHNGNKRIKIIQKWNTKDFFLESSLQYKTFNRAAAAVKDTSTLTYTYNLGSVNRQSSFFFETSTRDKTTFRWVLQRPLTTLSNKEFCNIKILSINLTNVQLFPFSHSPPSSQHVPSQVKANLTTELKQRWIKGGAKSCEPCLFPHLVEESDIKDFNSRRPFLTARNCLPCPPGSYFDFTAAAPTNGNVSSLENHTTSSSYLCKFCPMNTILNSEKSDSLLSNVPGGNSNSHETKTIIDSVCDKCGPGTYSTPGNLKCQSHCKISVNLTNNFNHNNQGYYYNSFYKKKGWSVHLPLNSFAGHEKRPGFLARIFRKFKPEAPPGSSKSLKASRGRTFERFDLTPLSGIHLVKSDPLFTAGGTGYQYSFAFELCRPSSPSPNPIDVQHENSHPKKVSTMLEFCLETDILEATQAIGGGVESNGNGDSIFDNVKDVYGANSSFNILINDISPFVCRSVVVPYNLTTPRKTKMFEASAKEDTSTLNIPHTTHNNVSYQKKSRSSVEESTVEGDSERRTWTVSLGDEVIAIGTLAAQTPFIRDIIREKYPQLYKEAFYHSADDDSSKINASTYANSNNDDLQLIYRSTTPTLACPDGRYTIVTLKCDKLDVSFNLRPIPFSLPPSAQPQHWMKQVSRGEPNKNSRRKLYLPPECRLGTCDGCNFRIIWETIHACPVCDAEWDVDTLAGECSKGKQLYYFYPKRFCKPENISVFNQIHYRTCTVLSYKMRIVILIIAGSIILLLMILYLMWKRNRKLEYKYMALIRHQTASSKRTAGGYNNRKKRKYYQVHFSPPVKSGGDNLLSSHNDSTSANNIRQRRLDPNNNNNQTSFGILSSQDDEDEDLYIAKADSCALRDGETDDELSSNSGNGNSATQQTSSTRGVERIKRFRNHLPTVLNKSRSKLRPDNSLPPLNKSTFGESVLFEETNLLPLTQHFQYQQQPRDEFTGSQNQTSSLTFRGIRDLFRSSVSYKDQTTRNLPNMIKSSVLGVLDSVINRERKHPYRSNNENSNSLNFGNDLYDESASLTFNPENDLYYKNNTTSLENPAIKKAADTQNQSKWINSNLFNGTSTFENITLEARALTQHPAPTSAVRNDISSNDKLIDVNLGDFNNVKAQEKEGLVNFENNI